MIRTLVLLSSALAIAACKNSGEGDVSEAEDPATTVNAPEVSFKPGDGGPARTSKLSGPVRISYRVIGTPIVGQPVAIDLRFDSNLGTEPFEVSFRVNDATAMQMPETQAEKVTVSPLAADSQSAQQVTVIPLREGRLYLNVAASVETESGSMSTVTAIPIQVGPEAERALNGTVVTETDENGEAVISLPGATD
ncbi:MAG: hypothetical protein KJO82_14230 [Gammaproteobacteria bacterium]|nr:hypothetical protein [Gammaproteobacteria bacterium]